MVQALSSYDENNSASRTRITSRANARDDDGAGGVDSDSSDSEDETWMLRDMASVRRVHADRMRAGVSAANRDSSPAAGGEAAATARVSVGIREQGAASVGLTADGEQALEGSPISGQLENPNGIEIGPSGLRVLADYRASITDRASQPAHVIRTPQNVETLPSSGVVTATPTANPPRRGEPVGRSAAEVSTGDIMQRINTFAAYITNTGENGTALYRRSSVSSSPYNAAPPMADGNTTTTTTPTTTISAAPLDRNASSSSTTRSSESPDKLPPYVRIVVVPVPNAPARIEPIPFKIRRTTPLRRLMDNFCRRAGCSTIWSEFLFEGEQIGGWMTAEELGVETDAVIRCVERVERVGR
ncbi:uncharacterized protein EV422DRAFT_311626 [Fimicolochytrium jonesii]|uniref:uncharacterized protein n=1 Tax=Fimicolochytrium jonesii TaxID=1396493 RepID=UPI0022FF22AF|nr:uncharacterized protein EV422DRAFT_311626 [Fimicolochytrium jonesii]KAI8824219.1 hypothetical protein EV422DRAFT_311626 [Fimicolochytrium jonesii]